MVHAAPPSLSSSLYLLQWRHRINAPSPKNNHQPFSTSLSMIMYIGVVAGGIDRPFAKTSIFDNIYLNSSSTSVAVPIPFLNKITNAQHAAKLHQRAEQ